MTKPIVKTTPVATPTRSPAKPATTPVIPSDQAFGNLITAQRDASVVREQALRSDLAAREGQYERDRARLDFEYSEEREGLLEQIRQQVSISGAADAALGVLAGGAIGALPAEVSE